MIQDLVLKTINAFVKNSYSSFSERSQKSLSKQLKLLFHYIYEEHLALEKESHFVNIHSRKLKKFKVEPTYKGKKQEINYSILIENLKEMGLIEVNEIYSVTKFSKSYRPTKRAIESPLIYDPTLPKRGVTNRIDIYLDKYPDYQKNIIDSTRATIDFDNYQYWLTHNKGITLKPTIKKVKNKKGQVYPLLIYRVLDQPRINKYLYNAEKINNGDVWFKVSDAGRLYSSFSNISYTAVDYILIDSEPTENIDVTNAQPLFLAGLLSKKHEKYRRAVESGEFYDLLAQKLGVTRHKAKLNSYRYIFFSNYSISKNKRVYDIMVELFGVECVEEIEKIKSQTPEGMHFSEMLQKIESSIFIKGIGRRKNFPSVTRHDEVVFKKNDRWMFEQLVRYHLAIRDLYPWDI